MSAPAAQLPRAAEEPVRCFLLKPTPLVRVALVRYVLDPLAWTSSRPACPGPYGYHRAEALAGVDDAAWERRVAPRGEVAERLVGDLPDFRESHWTLVASGGDSIYRTDPRWPTSCTCGYVFDDDDPGQVRGHLLYRRADRPRELVTKDEAQPGAMYFAWWITGGDLPPQLGASPLYVRLPNGQEWSPDSRASNCARRRDRTHHCWIARGAAPAVTVDKRGDTCAFGSGLIVSGSPGEPGYWAGRLIDGELIPA